jgi:hypothetical protein
MDPRAGLGMVVKIKDILFYHPLASHFSLSHSLTVHTRGVGRSCTVNELSSGKIMEIM